MVVSLSVGGCLLVMVAADEWYETHGAQVSCAPCITHPNGHSLNSAKAMPRVRQSTLAASIALRRRGTTYSSAV